MPKIQNSRVLITGGAGFVGSYLVEQLLEEDVAEIVIVDNFVRGSRQNLGQSLSSPKVKVIEGDIRDQKLLIDEMEGIDFCFHLAALRITHCASDPRLAQEVMYGGTFNVLDACVKRGVKKLVLASTASIYGQAQTFPTREDHHPYNNFTLYGAAKMANELMCRAFQQMNGLQYNALRYFNIYGPRMDVHGKYTEVFIRWYHLIKEGKKPIIYGDGSQSMDFIYVSEVARATILALKADVSGEVFNVASGRETSLNELCLSILEAMGSGIKPEYITMPEERKKVEVLRRLADVAKAKRLLDFENQITFKNGLKKLIEWLNAQENVLQK